MGGVTLLQRLLPKFAPTVTQYRLQDKACVTFENEFMDVVLLLFVCFVFQFHKPISWTSN